ncbi:MAG TPA: hypothetical protein VLX92_19850 [Kofleriaceae bacterium]|nr:hypothetical protein [Kofleriaceae bacterium]
MSKTRTPLDPQTLSPAARKALGPGPAKMMAARGMAPLPPMDQVAVLYEIIIGADAGLAAAARTTVTSMPDPLIAGALADARVDPRVLDLFAELVGDRPSAFEALVANPSVADDTIVVLAQNGGASEIERIAANEQRLLRHPQIIAAMYGNRSARMSTVDRAIELAVRNNIRVPGLAAWDEIARALQTAPGADADDDAVFAAALAATNPDDSVVTVGDADQVIDEAAAERRLAAADDADVPFDKLSIAGKIRFASIGNGVARARAIRSPVKMVAMAAIKAPAVTEFEAANYASNHSLVEDVIRYVATRREWTKLYGTKVALCRNPKTPIPDAMRLMPFLREKDLVSLTKSKGIPSAVVAQARKLLMQRRSSGNK